MAAPKTWTDAAERCERLICRAEARLTMAKRCQDADARHEYYGEVSDLLRTAAEPFASYMKKHGQGGRVADYYEVLATLIPQFKAITELRKARFHDGAMVQGFGAMHGPLVINAGPNESVTVQFGGDGFLHEHRTTNEGLTTSKRTEPVDCFDFLAGDFGFPLDADEDLQVRVPGDLELAITAWKILIPRLLAGWTPLQGPPV